MKKTLLLGALAISGIALLAARQPGTETKPAATAPANSGTEPPAGITEQSSERIKANANPAQMFLLTLTPGETWDKNIGLFQQKDFLKHGAYWNPKTGTAELAFMSLIDDGRGGCVAILQARSLEEAQTIADADPAVTSKLLKAQVQTMRPIAWLGEMNPREALKHFEIVRGRPVAK